MNHQGAVLAVDDNATARKTLELRLHSKGYQVDTAADGYEALELIEQNHYDVVLLDRKMPEFSGIEMLRELRNRHSVSELPVIMLTSTENSEAIVEALQVGANDYIIKPGELAVIDARIRAMISVMPTSGNWKNASTNAPVNCFIPMSGCVKRSGIARR
jgi:DNA-binding response OmpR family regulator